MSTTINLSGVTAAEEKAVKKFVEPGIHNLTISGVELTEARSGTAGLKVTFDSAEAEASFTETFWTTPGALPRIQYLLLKFDGEEHQSDISLEALQAKLIGKTQTCIVDGREALSNPVQKEDGTTQVYTNVYPQLRFAGFVGTDFTEADVRIERLEGSTSSVPGLSDSNQSPTNSDIPF